MNRYNTRRVIILFVAVGLFFLLPKAALCAYWTHYTPPVTTPFVAIEGDGQGWVNPIVSSGSPTHVIVSTGAYTSAEESYIPFFSGISGNPSASAVWALELNLQLLGLAPGEYAEVSVTGKFNASGMANGEKGLGNYFPGTPWGTGSAAAAASVTLNLSTSTGLMQQYFRDIYVSNNEDYDAWAWTPGYPDTPADTIISQHPMVNGDVVFMGAVFGLYSGVSINTPGDVKAETYGEFNYEVLAEVKNLNTPVPIPGAVWLLGSGLIGLMGLRKELIK